MKIINRNYVITVALFSLLWTVPTVSAFYAPQMQKWVNRDPYDEVGFEAIRRYIGRPSNTGNTEHNVFAFPANNPVSNIDALGLTKWQKCSPQQQSDIASDLAAKCQAAQARNCFRCLSRGHRIAMNRLCNGDSTSMPSSLQELTVVCETSPGGGCPPGKCGWSYVDSRVIHICFPTAETDPACGDLGCTALHESAHAVGGVGDDNNPGTPGYDSRAYDIEQCAGCPRSPGF